MKKLLLLVFAIVSLNSYSQKSKPAKKPAAGNTVLTKSGDLSAGLMERRDNYRFYVLSAKDTLMAKTIAKKNGPPSDVKITPFTCGGSAKFHSITWTEKKTVGDAKSKLENIAETHTEIWDIVGKTKAYENVQMVNNITEIVWLDPNKTASKTVEKIQRGGSECYINQQGDIVLKSKGLETRLTYDAASKKFVPKK